MIKDGLIIYVIEKKEVESLVVEMRNLIKRYGDNLAVDNVNLSIREGEIFGLLGPNGAGKTTIINMLVGLTLINSGEIFIFGKKINGHNGKIKRDIGLVPQEIAIYDDLTAAENVTMFGNLYGLRGNGLKDSVQQALSFTGLEDRAGEFPKKFSGGMKRRLNIACAVVHHPGLIIMDEPTVGIDPQSRQHILNSVMELNKQGATVIYTSHYMEEVEELCTRVAIMDQGRIIARGTNEELKALVSTEEKLDILLGNVNYTLVDNLKKLPEVKECSLSGEKLSILAPAGSGIISRVIDIITATGADVLSLEVKRPSLESVFLTLTGKTLRD